MPHTASASSNRWLERVTRDHYRYFLGRFPNNASLGDKEPPAVSCPEMNLDDNSDAPNESLARGIVYSVPFYRPDGNLGGVVASVIPTSAIQSLIQQPYISLSHPS